MQSKTLNWLELGSIINQTVKHYKSDLIHDGVIFARNVGKSFYYQIRPHGTHICRTNNADMVNYFRHEIELGRRYFRLTVRSVDNGPEIEAVELDRAEIILEAN